MTHEQLPSQETQVMNLEWQLDGLIDEARDGDLPVLYDSTRNKAGETVEYVQTLMSADTSVGFTRVVDPDPEVPTRYSVTDIDQDLHSGGHGAFLDWDSTNRSPSLIVAQGVLHQSTEIEPLEIAKVGPYITAAINGDATVERPFIAPRELTPDEVLDPEGTRKRRIEGLLRSAQYEHARRVLRRDADDNPEQAATIEALLESSVDSETGMPTDEGIDNLLRYSMTALAERIVPRLSKAIAAKNPGNFDRVTKYRKAERAEKVATFREQSADAAARLAPGLGESALGNASFRRDQAPTDTDHEE